MENIYAKRTQEALSSEEYESLIINYKTHKNVEDLNKLIIASLPLIKKFANEAIVAHKSKNYEDYYQQATLEFIKALDGYDLKREAKFVTYLYSYIPGALKSYAYKFDKSCINLKKNYFREYLKVLRLEEEYIKKWGCKPSEEEKFKHVEISPKSFYKYEKLFSQHLNISSLNDIVNNKNDDDNKKVELQETIVDNNKNLETQAINNVLLNQCLDCLNERNRRIVVMYYIDGLSQTEIAKEIGVSQVRISRIVKSSMRKMKQEMGVI